MGKTMFYGIESYMGNLWWGILGRHKALAAHYTLQKGTVVVEVEVNGGSSTKQPSGKENLYCGANAP